MSGKLKKTKLALKKANLTMTIPEEEDESYATHKRKGIRTRLFKEHGINYLTDPGATSTTSLKSAKRTILGDQYGIETKPKIDSPQGMKINLIMLDGQEMCIQVADLNEDPLYAVMAFAIEYKINDLALIEILRRKAQREIMRIKGQYNRRPTHEMLNVGGDSTPEMSTSTLQSIYKEGHETMTTDLEFRRKPSLAYAIPKSGTPKGLKSATSKVSVLNTSNSGYSSNSQLTQLMAMFDSKRKSDNVFNLPPASQKSPTGARSIPKGSPKLNKSKTEQVHTKQDISAAVNDGQQKQPGEPSQNVQLQMARDKSPSFMISPCIHQVADEQMGEDGVPQVSYKLDFKKNSDPFRTKPSPAKPKAKESPESDMISKIFGILDSDNDGQLSRTAIDMGALMDVSIDLLDALQDVIGDVFESDDPVDVKAFTQMIKDRCDISRLMTVYGNSK